MSKASVEVEGFVSEPRLSVTASGKQVCNVSVAHTPRRKNRETGEWEDAGPTLWARATFWEEFAEVVVNTVRKGDLVLLRGEPTLRTYEKDGAVHAALELKGAQIAVIPRAVRGQGASTGSFGGSGTGQGFTGPQNAGQDEWASGVEAGLDGLDAPF